MEELFYRATRLAVRRGTRRQPGQTWREWTLSLPDPARRSKLSPALEIFEKSKYGRLPLSASDFSLLEETIRAVGERNRVFIRIFIVWFRLSPFVLGFLRDRRRWVFAGPPRLMTVDGHRERARKLTSTIASLGPSFIKLAQVFAIRADIIPPIYLEALAKLHDRVPPFPTAQVRRRIREELKQDPDLIFERLDSEPMAAASLGQVHRARYHGEEVIIKVLRPGVEEPGCHRCPDSSAACCSCSNRCR